MDELNTDQQIKMQTSLKSHRCGFKELHVIVSCSLSSCEDMTPDMFGVKSNAQWWSVRLNLLSFGWNSINKPIECEVFTTNMFYYHWTVCAWNREHSETYNRNRSHKNEGNYYDMGFMWMLAKVNDIYRPHGTLHILAYSSLELRRNEEKKTKQTNTNQAVYIKLAW